MQITIKKQEIIMFPYIGFNYDMTPLLKEKEEAQLCSILSKTLAEKGLDRMTDAKIEYLICTSILSASM